MSMMARRRKKNCERVFPKNVDGRAAFVVLICVAISLFLNPPGSEGARALSQVVLSFFQVACGVLLGYSFESREM
jgi:hypothetical protein